MSEKRTVVFSDRFPRILKELRKKYRHVEEDVDDFADTLEEGETPGDRLQGTGDHIVYKARLASRDMQRGKSGGFRAIYYLKTESHIIIMNYPAASYGVSQKP
jgi:mRNA-degrading endonuclease RelE of RelBE toxin-antitoxin system